MACSSLIFVLITGLLVAPEDYDTRQHLSLINYLQSRNFTISNLQEGTEDLSSAKLLHSVCDLLGKGLLGFFSTVSSPIISSISSAFDIPYCNPETRWEGPTNGFSTSLSRTQWKTLLRELLEEFDPNAGIGLLYEGNVDSDGSRILQTLIEQPSPINQVYVRSLDHLANALSTLRDRVRLLFVHCSPKRAQDLLKKALQLNLKDHHYVFVNFDTSQADIDWEYYSSVNFTVLRLVQPPLSTKEALMLDCAEALNQGLISLPSEIESQNLSCDVGSPWSQGLTLINYISSVDFLGRSGRITFREGERSSVTVGILRVNSTLGFLEQIGQWTWPPPSGKLSGLHISKRFNDDANSKNVTLVVTTVLETPYVMLLPNHTGNSQFIGFSVDLLKLIAKNVGFNYVLEFDKKYGAYDPEGGEWNGVVKKLIERKADLAIGSMTINYARESVIDFTKPFMHLGISILFKVPSRQSSKLFSFLNPLAFQIWLLIVFAYICVSLTMYLVSRFSHSESEHFGLSNSFWYPIGTLMQQGSDLNPRKTSTRLVAGFWWFFSLVIISSYTANLAAFLTVERMSTPIESAEDLVDQSEIEYGTLDSGSTQAFFRNSKIETYQRMWRFMESRQHSVFVSTYEEGIRRVLEGNYAFLMESSVIEYLIKQNCNLTQIGGLLDSKSYGLATPIGSPWRDKISLAILEMTEKGIIQKLMTRWWQSASSIGCSSEDLRKKKEASALGVDSIGGVFIVLIVGLTIAIIVAIFEFCVHAKRNSDSICSEMAREARFAVRCRGTRRRPALHRHCASCSDGKPGTPRRPPPFHDYNTYPHEHHVHHQNGVFPPPIYTQSLSNQLAIYED